MELGCGHQARETNMKILAELIEAFGPSSWPRRGNDPVLDAEMADYHDELDVQDKEAAAKAADEAKAAELAKMGLVGGTYVVRWTGQSHEWYGDGPPSSNDGRYKQKGDGGKIIAYNVPREQAVRMVDQLDRSYKNKTFYDKSVYGKWGKDYYMVDYEGARAYPVEAADPEELYWDLKYANAEDYSKK